MAPLTTARPLLRALPRQQQLLHLLRRQPQRQQQQPFSIMHNLRAFARSFEPHPFQRLPVTAHPAPADWGKLVKRSATQAAVYFPLGFALLGWPYLGAVVLDGWI